MREIKHLLGYQKCTFKSQKWYLYIHEMRNFDKKLFYLPTFMFLGHNPYISDKFTEFSAWFVLELKQKQAKAASTLQPFSRF